MPVNLSKYNPITNALMDMHPFFGPLRKKYKELADKATQASMYLGLPGEIESNMDLIQGCAELVLEINEYFKTDGKTFELPPEKRLR